MMLDRRAVELLGRRMRKTPKARKRAFSCETRRPDSCEYRRKTSKHAEGENSGFF